MPWLILRVNSQTLAIDLQPSITSERPSVELPRQRWQTAGAVCASNGANTASMVNKCASADGRAKWRRKLKYTPSLSENGMSYDLYLQATDNGLSQGMLAGDGNDYKYSSALGGTACGASLASLCPAGALTFKPAAASITVKVSQVVPLFEGNEVEGTPAEGRIYMAYPNCRMPGVEIRVWKPLSQITLSLTFGSTAEDKAQGHNYASPAPFGFASQPFAGCVKENADKDVVVCTRYGSQRSSALLSSLYGMRLDWTPPLEAAGLQYKVCVVATDDAPSSVLLSESLWGTALCNTWAAAPCCDDCVRVMPVSRAWRRVSSPDITSLICGLCCASGCAVL